MIKKIKVENLQLGMFVCGSDRKWIDLPFFRSKFLINTQKEITTLQSYCKYVLIDTDKGSDEADTAEFQLPEKSSELADTFEFDDDFEVVELSSGELGLIKTTDAANRLYIMTDIRKQLLLCAKIVTLAPLEKQNLKIVRQFSVHDPLCNLLMAIYARAQESLDN